MNATLLAFISIGLYGLGALYEAVSHLKPNRTQNLLPVLSGLFALSLHVVALTSILSGPNIDAFSIVNSASIITCFVVAIFALISLKKPIQSMLLIVYPLAITSILALLIAEPSQASSTLAKGILAHVSLSILAYSVLSLAAVQAILVVYRNRNLKQHQERVWLNKLPPLLVMESVLFDLLRAGTILLGGAIVLGFVFIDDLFAQHLAHKSFFSIISFGLYSTLLFGRGRYGWRGSLAATLTLWGTGSLMVGFFGTKLVLEAIL